MKQEQEKRFAQATDAASEAVGMLRNRSTFPAIRSDLVTVRGNYPAGDRRV